LSFLFRVHAFNITICDCKDSQPKGFLKFSSIDCDFQISPLAPVPVYYDVFFTLPEITRFVSHTCTMWLKKNTDLHQFLGWQTSTQLRIPMETTVTDCEKMGDSRLCNTETMDYPGDNKWSLEGVPNAQGKWLLVTGDQLVNCRLEEVTYRPSACSSSSSHRTNYCCFPRRS
jgi:hypothetical protein